MRLVSLLPGNSASCHSDSSVINLHTCNFCYAATIYIYIPIYLESFSDSQNFSYHLSVPSLGVKHGARGAMLVTRFNVWLIPNSLIIIALTATVCLYV